MGKLLVVPFIQIQFIALALLERLGRINPSILLFNGDGKFFNGANNRMFLFKNGGVGIDLLGEFHYIDYSDLSSFKIPLTFDGNAMNQACRSCNK